MFESLEVQFDRNLAMYRCKFERLFDNRLIILQALTLGFMRDLIGIFHRTQSRSPFENKF